VPAFVRCEAKRRVARLLYEREASGAKGPTRRVGDGWIGHAIGAPTNATGERRTADELLRDPRFALD
jgi:hypothetical protein